MPLFSERLAMTDGMDRRLWWSSTAPRVGDTFGEGGGSDGGRGGGGDGGGDGREGEGGGGEGGCGLVLMSVSMRGVDVGADLSGFVLRADGGCSWPTITYK